jgi:hypothetical protein
MDRPARVVRLLPRWAEQHGGSTPTRVPIYGLSEVQVQPAASLVANPVGYGYSAAPQGWDQFEPAPPFVVAGEDGMLGHEEWRVDVAPESFWTHNSEPILRSSKIESEATSRLCPAYRPPD